MSFPVALKTGEKAADIRGVRPELVFGLIIAVELFRERGIPLVITSGTDGKHGPHSLHYSGAGMDIRLPSRYTLDPTTDRVITTDLRGALGAQFDVVLETDHIHVEFDPK